VFNNGGIGGLKETPVVGSFRVLVVSQ